MSQNHDYAIAKWTDKYLTRIDLDLTNAWPSLADRIVDSIEELSWRELAFGPKDDFGQRSLEPRVQAWVERFVSPILRDAEQELLQIVNASLRSYDTSVCSSGGSAGTFKTSDGAMVVALPAGLLLASGTLVAGIVSTTWLWIVKISGPHCTAATTLTIRFRGARSWRMSLETGGTATSKCLSAATIWP